MSQVSIIDIEGNQPQIPTQFDANIGFAIPIANVLEIFGTSIAAGSTPVHTVGSGNNITTQVQTSQAIAASDATKIGLAAFNSSQFTVDANGFVGLIGGSSAIDSVATNIGGPIFPNGAGQISILGTIAGASANPLRSNGTVANTVTLIAQVASAQVGSGINNAGMASFDSSMFTVDGNGFVTLIGGSLAIDSIAMQTGTSPVVPTGAGLLTFNGAVVAAGTNPVRTDGTGANTMALEIQISQAIAAADATKIGLSNFSSTDFTVAATGFVALSTTGAGKTITGNSGGALPPAANNWNIFGAVAAAGTSPVATSGAVSTLTVNVQTSQAIAAADATKIGLSNFDSSSFAVAATGFVTLSTTGAGKTITGDTGGALSPTANNWNILGGPGCTTSGSGSTLTINAVTMTDQGASTTIASDNGYFVTGNFSMTLPAAPTQGEIVRVVADTSSTVTITGNTGQTIRVGNSITAAAGSITNTAQGDVITLCYRAATTNWISIGGVGNWNV